MQTFYRFTFVVCLAVFSSACASNPQENLSFETMNAVEYHDARGSRLDSIVLESSPQSRFLVGRVIAEGGQNPRQPRVEAQFFDEANQLVATSEARLEKDLGRRIVLRQRQGHFRLEAPEHFDRVELRLIAHSSLN